MAYHCAMKGCSNGSYRLKKWKSNRCEIHDCHFGTAVCICDPPFMLHPFPTAKKDLEARKRWIAAVKRADNKKQWKLLEPSKDQRVCSVHFVDGCPSVAHPDPELDLGYETQVTPKRKAPKKRVNDNGTSDTSYEIGPISNDEHERRPEPNHCGVSQNLTIAVLLLMLKCLWTYACHLEKKLHELEEEKKKATEKQRNTACASKEMKKTMYFQVIKSDKDCRFYTGITSKSIFRKLHDFVAPFVKRRWKGCSRISTRVKRHFTNKRPGPERKLNSVDEFLLVLMRLRLGLLNKDLADRMNISECLSSQIFQTWLSVMGNVFTKLVFWPTKDQIIATRPARYRHLTDLVSIIDCSEIFIESPKNLDLQFLTWSDYKHHNTLKFLISVAPNSAINFLSDVFCGRISDKAITMQSGYLDLLQPYDHIMADKGFPIQQECQARFVTVHVPPGRRGNAQMLPCQLLRTKKIANLRILVEQIIRRMKCFRILKYEMPLSIVYLTDKIVQVVGGLCNLQKSMYND